MTHITCRLTAKNRDQLGTLRSVMEYGLPFLLVHTFLTTEKNYIRRAWFLGFLLLLASCVEFSCWCGCIKTARWRSFWSCLLSGPPGHCVVTAASYKSPTELNWNNVTIGTVKVVGVGIRNPILHGLVSSNLSCPASSKSFIFQKNRRFSTVFILWMTL